jgi:hypothetical protein
MSTLYILNIVGIYIVFKLGYTFYYGIFVTIFISLLQCITNLYFARQTFGYSITYFLKGILPQCITTIAIAVAVMYFINTTLDKSFARLVVSALASTAIIIITGYFVILNKEEKQKFAGVIKGFVSRKKGK